MKYKSIAIHTALLLLSNSDTFADENYDLPEVNIETHNNLTDNDSAIGSKSVTTSTEIKLFDSAELINPYKAISLEPGVDIRFNDPLGMSITHKIRGKSDRNVGETLEGLPLKGIGPGGGLSTMVDIENIDYINVEKGAIKADSGFGYGSDNGMVDMHFKAPSNNFGTAIKQAFGSDSLSKTYMRVDTGNIEDTAKIFISGSYTDADKWKGEGKATKRKNFEFGIASTPKQDIKWELYGIYNDEKKHGYQGLTFEQSENLSEYKDLDYQTDDPTKSDYYDYHRQDFETYSILGKVEVPLSNKDSFTLRPYFLHDKGKSWSTTSTNIIEWIVDHDTYGVVAEYEHKIDNGKVKLGYWYQEDEPPGPPTSRKLREFDTYKFSAWERLIDVEKNSIFHAPYITAEKEFGNTVVEAGLKYLWLSTPTLKSYDVTGIGDVSYESALSEANNEEFTLDSNTYEVFLPNIGLTHYINDNSYIRASYGRNYNTPQYGLGGGVVTYYRKMHMSEDTLQDMWDDIKPEESDNFDIGYGYSTSTWKIDTTLFYSDVKNVAGSFYDPTLDFTYQQNMAKAQSYGAELAASYKVLDNLNLNLSLTYNKYEFKEDVETSAGTTIKSKGRQLPDAPEFTGNLSLVYDYQGYKLSPVLRYLGKRYADVENKYSVDPYWLLDFSVNKEYSFGNKKRLDLSFSVTNLLDEEYISTISTSDTNDDEAKATYLVGAQRSLFFSVQYRF